MKREATISDAAVEAAATQDLGAEVCERSQAVIVRCDQLEDGDQIWFYSRFEAEQTCDNGCCEILPAPADYDGPKFYAEGDSA